MYNDTHGLMVTIDVQPSEQLGYREDLLACICASICDDKGLTDLVQYKCTEAKNRPDESGHLADFLSKNNYIHAIGIFARYKSIEKFGRDFLSTIPAKVAIKNGKHYKINGKNVNEKVALMLPWLAASFCFIALKAAKWAKELKQTKVTLISDKLPGSPDIAMEFMRRLSHHPDILPAWKETEQKYGVKFSIANMGSYTTVDQLVHHPDQHPTMIMTDWLAHSVFAAINKAEDLDGGAFRDEEYRLALIKPYHALYSKKSMTLLSVDKLITGNGNVQI